MKEILFIIKVNQPTNNSKKFICVLRLYIFLCFLESIARRDDMTAMLFFIILLVPSNKSVPHKYQEEFPVMWHEAKLAPKRVTKTWPTVTPRREGRGTVGGGGVWAEVEKCFFLLQIIYCESFLLFDRAFCHIYRLKKTY